MDKYPPRSVLMQAIGTAMAKSRAETEQTLRAAIARLEARVALLETAADAERNIRQVAAGAIDQINQRSAELERVGTKLDAILEQQPQARRAAAARLRQ